MGCEPSGISFTHITLHHINNCPVMNYVHSVVPYNPFPMLFLYIAACHQHREKDVEG